MPTGYASRSVVKAGVSRVCFARGSITRARISNSSRFNHFAYTTVKKNPTPRGPDRGARCHALGGRLLCCSVAGLLAAAEADVEANGLLAVGSGSSGPRTARPQVEGDVGN